MKYIIIYMLACCLSFALVSCDTHALSPVKDDSPVPDSIIQKAKTGPVTMEDMTDIVKLNGKIIPNETKQAKVYALVSGKIRSVSVELGDYVKKGQPLAVLQSSEVRQDNNTNLFTVADLSTVWIIANVYEADITNVHIGDEVTVNTLSDPEKNYYGKIDKIYDVLDPATRTMKVRISMNNRDNE